MSTPTRVTGHNIVGARVDAGGAPIDATPVTIASTQTTRYGAAFASAWNGHDTIIITGDNDGNYKDWRTAAAIFTSLPQIDAEPAARRRVAIASSAAEQASGSIASNGTFSLITWRESSGLDQAVVRAAFIAADGQLGAPIDLGEADSRTTTATASNGRDFLVAYVDPHYHLVARRVTLEGVLDPIPIVITIYGTPTDALAAGWSGQAYVVVTAGNPVVTISGITAEGTVAVPRQVIDVSEPLPADTPAVSCGVSGCRATWHTYVSFCCEGGSAGNNVMAITNAAGTILSQVLLTDSGIGVTPAISLTAADSESMFVYSAAKTMFAGRITAAGVILDPPALNGGVAVIVNGHTSPIPVAAVRSGIYWIDPPEDWALTGHLYWSMIDPEPRPHVVATIDMGQTVTLPLPMAASARKTYLVYENGDSDPSLMAPRLFVRTIASPDPQTSAPRRRATS